MPCDCLNQVKEKLHDHLMEGVPKGSEVGGRFDGTGWDNEVMTFSGNSQILVMLNYKLAYREPKKDGSLSKNFTRKEVKLKMSYCPMCGKSYEEEEANAKGDAIE